MAHPEELVQAVWDQLLWDSRLDVSGIQVEAIENKITLRGVVPSYPSLALASADAFAVTGVSAVENHMSVRLPAPAAGLRDEDIRAHVENALFWSPDVDASGIQVVVAAGRVLLRGRVTSFWQKHQALAAAQNIAGVTGVADEIQVRPVTGITDRGIAADLQAAFHRSVGMAGSQVAAEVERGRVTLRGVARDRHAYHLAESIADYTRGVSEVRNRLTILAE